MNESTDMLWKQKRSERCNWEIEGVWCLTREMFACRSRIEQEEKKIEETNEQNQYYSSVCESC